MTEAPPAPDPEKERARIARLFYLDPGSAHFAAATTHPSYAHEKPGEVDNQRLEFLGDAILDFVVSEELYERFGDYNEGQLTRLRAQLVSTEALARYARHHDIGAALRFGKGAGQGSLHGSDNVMADAVEALIAASYLDQGIQGARRACEAVIAFGMDDQKKPDARDTKSELQERVQALGLRAPIYRVIASEGPAHEVVFDVEVSVSGTALATGRGRSKRLAERAAALVALQEERYTQLIEGGPS